MQCIARKPGDRPDIYKTTLRAAVKAIIMHTEFSVAYILPDSYSQLTKIKRCGGHLGKLT